MNAPVVLSGMPSLQHAAQHQLDSVQHVLLFGTPLSLDAVLIHQVSADVQHFGTLLNLNAAPTKQESALVILIGMLLHQNAALMQLVNVPVIPVGTL